MRRELAALCLVACGTPTTTPATPPVTPVAPATGSGEQVAPAMYTPAPDGTCTKTALPQDGESEIWADNERRATSRDVCAVADNNIARDGAALLKTPSRAAAFGSKPWDHASKPKYLDLITRRFELQKPELALVEKNGFAVPARLTMPTYTHAYHEVFQSELPVFVSADSIFHAIFASNDDVIQALEKQRLAPTLAEALNLMACALPAAAAEYPKDVAHDLDVYLLVARSLLDTEKHASALGDPTVDREAAALTAAATAGDTIGDVALFGRPRKIDFTQYTARGHYAKDEELGRYFRAAMWASRLEFNLVSRSSRSSAPGTVPDPTETPREAIAALALADLAARSGADKHIATIDRAWGLLAGRREDVSIAQLSDLRTKARIGKLTDANAYASLKAAIGSNFRRTVRIHIMPEGSAELPAIATLIGPRIVPDAKAIMPLVNGEVPQRQTLFVSDVAYTMGFDHAKTYLASELAKFPRLGAQLEVGRAVVKAAPLGDDLYSAWWKAIRALADKPAGALPSFTTTSAGLDLRLGTIAAAYGQLKHNYVLIAGQPYAEFGCEIPDGYVEPVPAAYDALIEYAQRGARAAELLDPHDSQKVKAYFTRVVSTLKVLRAIVDDELADRPLTTVQKRWLGMVAELTVNMSVDTTGHPPMYTGWYFDLFYDREGGGLRSPEFIADYFTSQDGISYVGATRPQMGVFVVDTAGAPRAFVGPVARAYEVRGPLAARYSDESARTLAARDEPWAASYTLPAAPQPAKPLRIGWDQRNGKVVLKSEVDLGRATIKILDHHRVPLATKTTSIPAGRSEVAFTRRKDVGAVYLEVGAFRDYVVEDGYGMIEGRWGPPKSADGEDDQEQLFEPVYR